MLARVLALRVFLRLGAFGPVGQSRSVAALIATALPIDIYCHKTGPRAEAGGGGMAAVRTATATHVRPKLALLTFDCDASLSRRWAWPRCLRVV